MSLIQPLQTEKQLNADDAIKYLELVRTEFSDKPHIYIEFLDIMREFKSAVIGTEDVIERVILLFKDRVDIILGFNTFLPSGFVIEFLHGENDRKIAVTSPSGRLDFMLQISGIPMTSLVTANNSFVIPMRSSPFTASSAQFTSTSTKLQHFLLEPSENNSESTFSQNISEYISQQRQQYIPTSVQSQPHTPVVAALQLQQNQVRKRIQENIPFNEAIEYINRIKTRYVAEPDVYKEFLEMLQAYQLKEISNMEVGSRIQDILQKSPDLLNEFIDRFLPSSPGPSSLSNKSNMDMQTIENASGSCNTSISESMMHVIPPDAMSGKENILRAEGFNVNSIIVVIEMSEINSNIINSLSSPAVVNLPNVYNKKKRRNVEDNESFLIAEKVKKKKSNHNKISPTPTTSNSSVVVTDSAISIEEFTFFKRMKDFLGPASPEYQEFLKILTLYSRQILNEQFVVDRIKIILGDDGDVLLADFKKLIKYNEKQDPVLVYKSAANTQPVTTLDLKNCKPCGPSYRTLQKEYNFQSMPSTGMDEVAHEVLNDEWMSYPKCESEEQHIAQKRNVYAEAMNQCEEERYEFDLFMESLSLTIKILEPIKRKINTMTPQEKVTFRLPQGLGGKSLVYQRVIKKLYNGGRCNEVLDAVHQNPAMAVPVVLRRLKQKHEMWRKAHINWNKIWREINYKNYYKSLDFQGNTFKHEDKKKTLNVKIMLSEIEQLYQQSKINVTFQKYQYKYAFDDLEVLRDAVMLLRIYLYESERYDMGQRKSYCDFVETFLVNLLGLPLGFFGAHGSSKNNNDNMEIDVLDEIAVDNNKAEEEEETEINNDRLWTQNSDDTEIVSEDSRIDKCFFGNNYYYYFMRLFQILYSRLESLKNLSRPIRNNNPNHILQAGLQKYESNLDMKSYDALLDLIIKYLKSSKETATIQFEECVYRIFPTKGYTIFTIKQLLQSIAKQMQNVKQSKNSNGLWALYIKHKDHKFDNEKSVGTTRIPLEYQTLAKELIGDNDNMFRIESHKKVVSIAFYNSSSLTLEEDWSNYLFSYVNVTTTRGVDLKQLKMPFLRRNFTNLRCTNLKKVMKKPTKWQKNNLELSISRETSKIFFIDGSEDCFVSSNFGCDEKTLTIANVSRNKRAGAWREWLSVKHANFDDN
ncbi:5872_t:CDS:10 [Ambispora leptoticha]|uniref:5872_t:CDS:1 n=1 Tax=Ambispora leptoticha TaxID=144679 RepID=A0A9N8WR93_9GLOM|nr:5872_t:CDS:10 [Ambispora leptoticha]